MNITKERSTCFATKLGSFIPGNSIEFEVVPHQKHAKGSLFIVLRIPAQYIDISERKPDGEFRIMVANLETGQCSLVSQDRACRFVDAEVVKL